MNSNTTINIGDIAKINYGKGLKHEIRAHNGTVPVYGANGVVGLHDESLVNCPTIIIGRKGSVGEVTFAPAGGWPIDTTFYVELLHPEITNLRYLFYALKNANLGQHVITTSIPGINRDDIYNTSVYFPPLDEQKRIADILDKADALRVKRRRALARLDDLLKSVFLDMFGDPVTNPMGWKICEIQEVAANDKHSIKAGPFGSSLKKEIYTPSGYKIYGQEQVIRDDLSYGDYFIDEEKYQELITNRVQAGDILISLVGTFGKVSIVPEQFEPGIINPRLMKITLEKEKILPLFFKHLLLSESVKKQIESMAHGGTMGIVNVGIMKKIKIPVPPITRQIEYLNFVRKVVKISERGQKSLERIEALFLSLQENAFNGELKEEAL